VDKQLTEPWQTQLKEFIKNSEARFVWYKQELERMYKSGEAKADPEWMKTLKELKSMQEATLRDLREEQTHLNQGLNPPFFYRWPQKKS
jgi:hypothetical protein